MTVFEFVFGLFSVVMSLGIAHLLGGAADLIRHRRRVKFSLVHTLWMWSAFAITVGNWAGLWYLRDMTGWPSWSVLLMIMVAATCYFICRFVTPDVRAEGVIDLEKFHTQERVSYLSGFIALTILALIVNLSFHMVTSYVAAVRDSVISAMALALVLIPLFLKARWAQLTGAIGMALLGAFFVVSSTNIVTM